MAERHHRQKAHDEHLPNLRQAYFRGLNYLLREKTDKAIEAFAGLLNGDSQSIETHIALGNLFRQRGELEQAIEVHESLIGRDDLSPEQRHGAQFELGMDYLRAGLFDRAEAILINLIDHPVHGHSALRQLLHIYQHEKEWHKAIACVRKLTTNGKTPRGETVAQFHCELAEEALITARDQDAHALLQQALLEDGRCVRANLLLARLRMREGAFDDALQVLKRIESQNHAYLPEVLEPIRVCHERLNRPQEELLGYLGYLYETYAFESAALALAERLRGERGNQRAIEHLLRVLDTQSSLRALNMLSGLLLEEDGSYQRDALVRLDRSLDRMASTQARYRCLQCGFSGNELHWRCPSCRHWETMRPL